MSAATPHRSWPWPSTRCRRTPGCGAAAAERVVFVVDVRFVAVDFLAEEARVEPDRVAGCLRVFLLEEVFCRVATP